MLIRTLLMKCDTGFDLVVIVDSTSGHSFEYESVGKHLLKPEAIGL